MKKFLLLFALLGMVVLGKAQTDLIISEYVEGWSTNKALELYNPTNAAINLSTYRITRYSNGSDTPPANIAWTFMLPNRDLLPYHSYVIVGDKRDPLGTGQEAPVWAQLAQRADTFACPNYEISKTMYFNGNDAVVLEKQSGDNWLYVDIFARWGAPACALATLPGSANQIEAWTDVTPFFTGLGIGLTADHTLIRKSTIKNGVKTNPVLFNALAEYDSLPANTFKNLGWHKYDGAPANYTPSLNLSNTTFFVDPASINGTVVGTISASDAEGDPLRYYIDYGNFVYVDDGNPLIADKRYEPFKLDRETGVLSIVDNRGLIPEDKTFFYLETTVTDGFSQSETQDIKVIVTPPLTAINIGPSGGNSISTYQGTLQFMAESFPVVTYNPAIRYKWSVSDETIASIDTSGLVTALGNGTVNVICAGIDGSGVQGTYELTITGQPTPVTDLLVSTVGGVSAINTDNGTIQFLVEVVPSFNLEPDTRYMWMVDNEDVATISETGLLQAVTNGTVKVTCMATDASGIENSINISITGQVVSVKEQKVMHKIYPNPVSDGIFMLSSGKVMKSIVITDVASREVYRNDFSANQNTATVELPAGIKGIYMVSVIYNDNTQSVSKLIVR